MALVRPNASAERTLEMPAFSEKAAIGFLWHGDRNIGGGERSTYLLACGLGDRFRPIVIYSKHNKLIDWYIREGVETVQVHWSPRITRIYRDAVPLNPLLMIAYLFDAAKAVVAVLRIVRKYEIKILHPADNLSKLVGGVAGRLARIKVTTHCRDELGRSFIERCLLIYQLLFMHRIIAVAERIRNLFVLFRWKPTKVTTVHNGIDAAGFDPDRVPKARDVDWAWAEGCTVIGMIATFDRCKGHTYLFQACAKLKTRSSTRWRCVLVGDGRENDALKEEVARLGLQEEIQFLGYRYNIAEIIKGIDIVVVPSEQEAFPRVVLEAMAMQVPVVASDVGGLPEAVVHDRTGVIVHARDVDALAVAIENLIESPERRKLMGVRGRERVLRYFTIQENIRKIEQIYDEVLA